MCGDDGAADGQAQPDARCRALLAPALELLEQRFFAPGRDARATVFDDEADLGPTFVVRCTHRQGRARRRVLRSVLEQVDEHAFHQHGVQVQQRQVIGQVDGNGAAFEHTLAGAQGAADDFFQRLPLQVQRHGAGLQPRHVEQVDHECVHALRRFADGAGHLGLRRGHGRPGARQRLGQAYQRRQRRAQVVRHRRQQRVAQPLALHLHRAGLRHVDVVDAFERDRQQRRAGVEQLHFFGRPDACRRRGGRLHREHTAHAHRRLQRQHQARVGGQRVGAAARRAGVIEGPLRDAGIGVSGGTGQRLQLVLRISHPQRSPCTELGRDKTRGDLCHLLGQQRAAEVAAHRVQAVDAAFAFGGGTRLRLQARGQLTDQQTHHQHHRKGDEEALVGHRQREARRHEEQVEHQHRQHRRQHRRPAAVAHRGEHHRQHEQQHQAGELENVDQRRGQQRRAGAPGHRSGIGRPAFGAEQRLVVVGRCRRHGQRRRGARQRHLHHVELVGLGGDPFSQARPPGPAPRARLAAHHQPHQVVFARVAHQRDTGLGRRQRGGCGAELLRQLQQAQHLRVGLGGIAARLHMHGVPRHVELAGQPRTTADDLFAVPAAAHAGQQRLAVGPHRQRCRVACTGAHAGAARVQAKRTHLVIDTVGRAAQRQLAQRQQVALAEEVVGRALGLLRQVDLALFQPQQQLVGRQVDDDDLVGFVEHAVGHRLVHAHTGDAADDVVQAFQVLHVQRGPHVVAVGQQFFNVLPAFGVARAGRVAVRQFVEQQHAGGVLGLEGECAVEIELVQRAAAVFDGARGQPRQAAGHRLGVGAAVRFDDADQHRAARRHLGPCRRQHRIGFADAGTGAEEDLQPAARRARGLGVDTGQQRIRIGTCGFVHRSRTTTTPNGGSASTGSRRPKRSRSAPSGSPSATSARA